MKKLLLGIVTLYAGYFCGELVALAGDGAEPHKIPVEFRCTVPELRAWPAREREPRVWTNGRHTEGVWVLRGKTFELRPLPLAKQ